MRAVRFHVHGGADVLVLDELPEPVPGPGEIRIRVEAVGVNFIDIYLRSGFYLSDALPGSSTPSAPG